MERGNQMKDRKGKEICNEIYTNVTYYCQNIPEKTAFMNGFQFSVCVKRNVYFHDMHYSCG